MLRKISEGDVGGGGGNDLKSAPDLVPHNGMGLVAVIKCHV